MDSEFHRKKRPQRCVFAEANGLKTKARTRLAICNIQGLMRPRTAAPGRPVAA